MLALEQSSYSDMCNADQVAVTLSISHMLFL